jgi:redox-sensitive bicupin YhaK (pirin superfamily)
MKKGIDYILQGREKQITREESVLQPLPHKDFRFANPFILLHHLKPEVIPAGAEFRIHPHPHRGFSPVTFMLQGEGYHKDNAGHNETINAGDVQWMFAGKGVLHSEGPSKDFLKQGGVQEFIQLWINVPQEHKWKQPFYQSAKKEQLIPVIQEEGVNLRLASGVYDGKKGPIQKSFTPVISIIGEINKGKQIQLTATPGWWTLLYIAKGKVCIDQESIEQYHLIIFQKENDEILIIAEEDTQILFLSAEPLQEPLAVKDNFVMNTPEEIEQAFTDYKNGGFGKLDY